MKGKFNLGTNYISFMRYFTLWKITLQKRLQKLADATLLYLILHFKCGMTIPTFLWGSIK